MTPDIVEKNGFIVVGIRSAWDLDPVLPGVLWTTSLAPRVDEITPAPGAENYSYVVFGRIHDDPGGYFEIVVGRVVDSLENIPTGMAGWEVPSGVYAVLEAEGLEPGRITEIHAVGRDGFFNELIEAAGGENAYRGSLSFPRLSRESILFLDPEVIIDALSAGEDEQGARREWESLESLGAVRGHRLHLLTGGADTVPGPRSAQTLAKLSAAFHPEDSGAGGEERPGKNGPYPGRVPDQAGAFSAGETLAPRAEEAP